MTLRFPDWYYGGPYVRVVDPNRDLPSRDPAVAVAPDTQTRVEQHGIFDGARIVAPFGDANSLNEILGSLTFAAGFPDDWSDDERSMFPTIQGELAVLADRLREKAARARGPRNAWLLEALATLERAKLSFASGKHDDARILLRDVTDLVEGAARVSRRRPSILLGPGPRGEE